MRFNHSRVGKVISSTLTRCSEEKIDRKTLCREVPLVFRDLGVFVLIFSLILLPVPMTASAATTKKWGPHADITGKLGNERSLGDYDFFVPVLQGPTSMLFLDLRFQGDDNEATEGNFGLGYRQMIENSWIFGGYGFYDVRETQFDNKFRQWTFGVEALTENYDARVNGYFADEDEESVSSVTGIETFGYADYNLVHRATPGFEQSMSGVDFEVGGKLPALAYPEIRGYVGGFYFDAEKVDKVTGPSARLEVRFPDLFGWDGSLFELGGEIRDDSVRDTDYYFTARLRIPFGTGSFALPTSSLTALEKRMTERVQRDPDVVVGVETNTGTDAIIETPVTYNSAEILFHHYYSESIYNTGTFEEPAKVLDGIAGSAPVADIVLLHADNVYNGAGLVMTPNQRVLGEYAGMGYTVMTDQYGEIFLPHATDGVAMPQIINAPVGVTASDNSEISGIEISGASSVGLLIDSLTGPVDISNVTIDGGWDGVRIAGSSGLITFSSVTMTPGQKGFDVSNSSADIFMYNSNVFTDNNVALDVNNDSGSFLLDESSSITATGSAGTEAISYGGSSGSYVFAGAVNIYDFNGGAVAISGSTGATFDFNNLTISNSVGAALSLSNNDIATAVNVSGPSSITQSWDGDTIYVGGFIGDQSTLNIAETVPLTAYNGAGLQFNNADGVYNFSAPVVLDGRATGGDTGIDMISGSDGEITFDNAVTVNNPVGNAIYMADSLGSLTFTDTAPLVVEAGSGHGLYALDAGSIIVQGSSNTIDNTGGDGIFSKNTNLTVNSAVLGGTGVIGGAGIAVVVDDGATYNVSILKSTITTANGEGISIDSTGGGVLTAVVAGNDVDATNGNALTTTDDGTATGQLVIEVDNNTFEAVSGGYSAVSMVGTVSTYIGTIITSLADNTVIGNNTGGGMYYNSVTFDADASVVGIQQVVGGTTNIGQGPGARVVGDGLAVDNIEGDLGFTTLNIYNDGGTGLAVATTGTDDLSLSSDSGNIDTLEGAAIELVGVASTGTLNGNLVLDSVSSYNSAIEGVYLDVYAGDVAFSNVAIDKTISDGVAVYNSTGALDFGDVTATNAGINGINITGLDSGSVTFNSVTVSNTAASGLYMQDIEGAVVVHGVVGISNTAFAGFELNGGTGSVAFNDNLDTAETGEDGLAVVSFDGTLDLAGTTTLYNSSNTGAYVGDSAADVTINNLVIDGTGLAGAVDGISEGLFVENFSGTMTINSGSIYNTATDGIQIEGSAGDVYINDTSIQYVSPGAPPNASGIWMLENDGTVAIYNSTIAGFDSHGIHVRNITDLDANVVIYNTAITMDGLATGSDITLEVNSGDSINAVIYNSSFVASSLITDVSALPGGVITLGCAPNDAACQLLTPKPFDANQAQVDSVLESMNMPGINTTTTGDITIYNSGLLPQ